MAGSGSAAGRRGRLLTKIEISCVQLYSCTGMAVGLRSTALKKGVLVDMGLVTNF